MVFTLSTLYRVDVAGLNPLQLVLVGTALEAFVFLFEIPTGIVADIYSRKLSIVIGLALIGMGFALEGFFPYFAVILLSQALWGIGWTFTSGADSAWIADEIGEENTAGVFLKGSQLGQVGALLGIGASVLLARLGLGVPIFVGGLAFVGLAMFLTLTMPETGFKPTPQEDRNSWQAMARTFKEGVAVIRVRPILIMLLAVGLFNGLSSEGIDRLWQVHVMNLSLPAGFGWTISTWFGVISAVTMVLSILVAQYLTKKVDLKKVANVGSILVAVTFGFVLSVAAFALSGNFTLAIACYLALSLLRRTTGPLHHAWMNQGIPSQVRATVLSMTGQVDALGQMIGGPIIGLVATRGSVPLGVLAAAVILIPVPFFYILAVKKAVPAVTTAG